MSEILKYDQKHVWHPFTQMQTAPEPLVIVRAENSTLYAEDGKTYLDCNSSWWVNIHGHGHPYLQQALVEQFSQIDHIIFAGATHPKAVELSTRLVGLLPEKLQKVFFSDDGSTAVEVALKMVFQYWSNKNQAKTRILALEGAYHGDTFGAMSVSERGVFNKPFEHLFFEVDYIEFPSFDREEKALEQAEILFKTKEFAGIILEPLVQGSAGMRMYRPEFLNKICQLARKYDVLVIMDEIMTGWGRTGKLFAHNYSTESPDIVCLSKGLTGGVLPLGLTVATDEIYEAFLAPEKTKALLHGHSFTGNALACAVACANLDLISDPGFFDDIDRISRNHTAFYKRINQNEKLKDVRQIGTIIALEIKMDENSSYFSNIRDEAYSFFLENGMLLRPLGNIIFLNPPYCTTDEELVFMYQKIEQFISKLS
ncbi:MAG: adenosylmethionine--8-amino-7-oxononanoate transaminase [Flavobacteriia bacterium]|jgi:adenosylmethionine-8-amino-7-oxononanoate aminotransferase